MIRRANVALEPFVVQHEALDQVLGQPGSGPLPELCAPGGTDAVTDGHDGLQPVVLGATGNGSFSLLANL